MTARPAAGERGAGARRGRAQIARRLHRSVGDLTTAALGRMDRDMPWFRQMPAEDRSWIGLIVQAGINAFVTGTATARRAPPITAEVFGAAPRALAGVVSLHHTVEMVRLDHRGGRGEPRRRGRRGRRGAAPRGDPPLRPGDRVRHRGGVRPCRGDARRLGRPAGGAGRRLGAARRGRRDRALAGQRARLESRAPWRWCSGWCRTAPPAGPRGLRRRGTPLRAASRAGRALRGAGRPAGGGARRCAGPGQGGCCGRRQLRARPGGDRPAGARPDGRLGLGARRARRAAGRPRLAGGATAGDQRRPAARAGAGRRRARPPAAGHRGVPAAARGRPGGPGHGRGIPGHRRLHRGHRAGAVRAPEHGALPAAAGRGPDRALPRRPEARLHLPGGADAGPAQPARRRRSL